MIELRTPHHVTVGTTGQPGERTFFLQAQDDEELVTIKLEKVQAQGLSELLAELLAQLDDAPATDWDREAMRLRDPLQPRFAAGELALGVDAEQGRFALEVSERAAGDEQREARIWCDRDQARRLAAHAAEVVAQGRPACELCGRPREPDRDHVCPATNGHGRLSR